MQFEFEDRYYQVHEIQKKFGIKDKTWRNLLYGDSDRKRGIKRKAIIKDKQSVGLYKVPHTNYYVVDPNKFQDWFLEYAKVEIENGDR